MERTNALREAVGAKVRSVRLGAGMTQAELGAAAGMDHRAVSRLESGKTSPNLDTLDRLARAMGIGVTDLVG